MKKMLFVVLLSLVLLGSCMIQESAYVELVNQTSESITDIEFSWNTFDGAVFSLEFDEILSGEKEEFSTYLGEGASFPIITDDKLSLFSISYNYQGEKVSYNPTLLDFDEYPGMLLISGKNKIIGLHEEKIVIK